MQTTQEKLTSELQAAKSTILSELMGEMEERFATKTQLETEVSKVLTLRATAPEFSGSFELCHLGFVMRLQTSSDSWKEFWQDYHYQFALSTSTTSSYPLAHSMTTFRTCEEYSAT